VWIPEFRPAASGNHRLDSQQLRQISSLIEFGALRPIVDRVFPFESTNEAMAYVETGRPKGKVVVKVS
jgi:alcohol dehydrogenase